MTFKQIVHTITVTAGKNDTISPGNKVTVANGTNKTFKITPKKGYIIATLKVDGVNVKAKNNAYTFTNVTRNHTIYVTFKRK
ncbi:hypothetical protein CN692_24105 [Bacillus sp. AFS002410]|uniref:InlB B-repeat-containing protein n=1 Tax=Bacillus sp. AFS002410 TaxID=2033481 RepID=UPI000BEF93A1|nr:hypothetical protein [Bacillus sp. AFS002410]PEJ48372.1 hypothetical protein CN692_24105 [Bacillus sp. AFS002410]